MTKTAKTAPRPLTDTEQHERRLKEGIAKGAARRSENTRPRSLDEVRATVHDAYVQLRRYATKNRRPDFHVLAFILGGIRGAMTMQPWERAELAKAVRGFEEGVYRTGWRPDGSQEPREYMQPWLHVTVTRDGLAQLQQAVAERIAAGLLPPEPPVETPPGDAIDFATAAQRLRDRRADERRREP